MALGPSRTARLSGETRTLAEMLPPAQNNFTALRLLAAAAVIVSHAGMQVTGVGEDQALARTLVFSLGAHAVDLFFMLSGLTLAYSLNRTPDLLTFARRRALRIFPGLFVCAALLAFVVGPAVSTWSASDYLASPLPYLYVAKTVALTTGDARLPGVFETLPDAGRVNLSVWTLKYEAAVYVGLAALFALTQRWRRAARPLLASLLLVLALASLLAPASEESIRPIFHLIRLATCFYGGVALYALRRQLRPDWLHALAVVALFVVTIGTPLERMTSYLLTAAIIVIGGAIPLGRWRAAFNRTDVSYGTYVYGWPVAQLWLTALPGLGSTALIILTLPVAVVLGLLSWLLVERPALRLRPDTAAGREAAAASAAGIGW